MVIYTTESAEADAPAFDGEAHLALQGRWGSAAEVQLVNDSPSFAAGSVETFSLKASDVGPPTAVALRIVANAKAVKWSVDRVEVREGEMNAKTCLDILSVRLFHRCYVDLTPHTICCLCMCVSDDANMLLHHNNAEQRSLAPCYCAACETTPVAPTCPR